DEDAVAIDLRASSMGAKTRSEPLPEPPPPRRDVIPSFTPDLTDAPAHDAFDAVRPPDDEIATSASGRLPELEHASSWREDVERAAHVVGKRTNDTSAAMPARAMANAPT